MAVYRMLCNFCRGEACLASTANLHNSRHTTLFSVRRLPALFLLVGAAIVLLAAPTYSDGPQFELSWGAAVGGGGASTGGPYGVSGAAGEPAADELSGGDFSLHGGVEVGAVIVPPMAVEPGESGVLRLYVPAGVEPVRIDWIKIDSAGKTRAWEF